MPGIAGIISRNSDSNYSLTLQDMVGRLARESFYSTGTYQNPKLGVWVGWACHQGSFSDCLPVWNRSNDVCLVFCGEDFSDPGAVGGRFRQGSPAHPDNPASWLELYDAVGLKFLEELNGCFSGLLVDLREPTVVLFNDRYALQRIYYHENQDGCYFASEAKALLKVLPASRHLDLPSLGEYVSCGCVLQNRTIFSGITLLPGASSWLFSPGRPVRKLPYFRRETWESQPRLTEPEFYDLLKETFTRRLPRYLHRHAPVGMSLTGGLDARMIMAWAQCPPQTLPCYTFGGSYRDCEDLRLARQVAQVCGQDHQVLPVDESFLTEFPNLAEQAVYTSDGTMDVTGSVELYANRLARAIAPVRLTGNYGSEILRSNVAFGPDRIPTELFETGFERLAHAAEETFAEETHCHPLSFIAFKQVAWHHHARFTLEQSQLTPRSPYLDNELVALAYQAPADPGASIRACLRLVEAGNPILARIPTDRGLLYRPIPMLTKARNLWQEFTFKAEYAYDYGMPQWLARLDHLCAPLHLERLFLGRHKFYHFRVWYRDKLARYVKDILLDPQTLRRPYLLGHRVEDLVNGHLQGKRNHTTAINQLLTIELIQRQLIEVA